MPVNCTEFVARARLVSRSFTLLAGNSPQWAWLERVMMLRLRVLSFPEPDHEPASV